MNRLESNGKRIICAVDMSRYYEGKWVDYYVSDERIRKYSDICKEWKCLVDDKEKFVELGSQLEEAVKPISSIKKKEVKGCYIVFNRYLYHIGGLIYYGNNNKKYKTSKKVFKVDLNSMDSGWVKGGADMNCGRYNPYPVILEGELYVVGGLRNNIEDNVEKSVLMEVFKNDGSGWKMIPNPPTTSSICMYPQLRPFLAGVLKSKSLKKKDVIIVAIEYPGIFELYTYEAGAGEWMAYGKISTNEEWLRSIAFPISKPGVVSEQLMLYLGDTYRYCLCIMDLESLKLDTIDLIKAEVIPRRDVPKLADQIFLVMIEQGKFCLFYTVYGPITHEQNYYYMLKACIFTLEKKKEPTKRKRSSSSSYYYYYFDINIESRFLSHILDLTIGRVQAVCLVD